MFDRIGKAGKAAALRSSEATPRIPLNTLAIGFGLAGLADIWTTASRLLHLPGGISDVLWVVAGVSWVWLIAAHLVRGAQSTESLGSQLRHPAQGPIAALVPVIGMLLGLELHTVWAIGGIVLVLASITAAALFAAWQLGFLVSGQLKLESLHGAYFLPTVAASLVASTAAAEIGLPGLALGAFAVGIFFWVVIFALLLSRLAFLPPLPAPLTPTLAIIVAPPAVGGTAWFTMHGEVADPVSTLLLGLTVVMLLMQFALVPRYRKLQFSLGFWSFTFPFAAVGVYGIQWLSVVTVPGWEIGAAAILAAITVLIVGIGVRTLMLVGEGRKGAERAEEQIERADELIEQA